MGSTPGLDSLEKRKIFLTKKSFSQNTKIYSIMQSLIHVSFTSNNHQADISKHVMSLYRNVCLMMVNFNRNMQQSLHY